MAHLINRKKSVMLDTMHPTVPALCDDQTLMLNDEMIFLPLKLIHNTIHSFIIWDTTLQCGILNVKSRLYGMAKHPKVVQSP